MNTYLICDNQEPFAFEISNFLITINKVAYLLDEVKEVTNIEKRKLFKGSSYVHIKFLYKGYDFIVWEPFGDNSRYWIGPEKEELKVNISSLIETFNSYELKIVKFFKNLF